MTVTLAVAVTVTVCHVANNMQPIRALSYYDYYHINVATATLTVATTVTLCILYTMEGS